MKYYVITDPHGFYTATKNALTESGFFDDANPKKLIVCGDAMDRGTEAPEMQDFLMETDARGELIFIRGNHEDLLVDMVEKWDECAPDIARGISHHLHNGTFDTALQLTGRVSVWKAFENTDLFLQDVARTDYYSYLIPHSVDYYETAHYIFVHGWIPCHIRYTWDGIKPVGYLEGWRYAEEPQWAMARWFNGMACAVEKEIIEPGKTIVCGHWHTSWGHYYYERADSEWGPSADFSPFRSNGIIALDACTAHTGKVNCIVLED